MNEENKKDYTQMNLLRIGQQLEQLCTHLKHINWNLGKLNSILEGDTEKKEKIEKAMSESKE